MKNNKLLITIIGVVSVIVIIGMIITIVILEKNDLNIQNEQSLEQEQIIKTEENNAEEVYSVNEVIDNYEKYSGKVITIEGISPQNFGQTVEAYVIDNSNKEELKNQPLGQPKFNKNKAVLLLPTNRLENVPSVKYGDLIRVKGKYNTLIYGGVYYTYQMIVESIEVIGSIN